MAFKLLAGVLVLASLVCAQRRVDPRNTYHRVVCVVPYVGSGTADDPRRPMYAPWPPAPARTEIMAYTQIPSDDGKYALVEFVALDWAAFAPIFKDKSIAAFHKGWDKKDDIARELKKYRKDFDIEKFAAVLP